MRLSAVRVSNHSRLLDFYVDVRGHLVLVGPNDTGKSSLLRCLDLALGASTAQLYSRITLDDFRDTAVPLVVEVALCDFSVQDKALFPDEIEVDAVTGDTSLMIRLEATVDANETLEIRRTAPRGGTGRQLSRDQLSGIGWRMVGAVAGARDLRGDRNSPIDDLLRSVELGAEKAGFEKLIAELRATLNGSAVLDGLRGRLAGQLSRALPEAIDKNDLEFVPGATASDDVLSDVQLQVLRHGSLRSLTEQSDGTRALFAIALYDLMSATANMVAIDEPEIHLHPTSQRSLARLLQGSGNQKIVATHSPDIVGAFQPEEIVSVKPGGRVVQPERSFLSDDERMAVRWWVRDKLEPLTAARVVGVEGISDRIILEQCAAVTSRELDRLGVCVVETNGSGDMGAILKLFGESGFKVAMSLLIDEDAVSATAARLGVAPAELPNRSVWVSRSDLEAEYVQALGADAVWDAITASKLFSGNELRQCTPTGPGGKRTDTDVAAFCRRKADYKVRAAMAVANVLTNAQAKDITSVEALLVELTGTA